MKVLLLAIATSVAIACATPVARTQASESDVAASAPDPSAPTGLQRLTNAEIRSLMSDHWVAAQSDFNVRASVRNEEFFCESGMWGAMGARVPLAGRYTINNDELCVLYGEGDSFCRLVFRDANGRYFTQRLRSEPPAEIPIEVRIYTQEHAPHCS